MSTSSDTREQPLSTATSHATVLANPTRVDGSAVAQASISTTVEESGNTFSWLSSQSFVQREGGQLISSGTSYASQLPQTGQQTLPFLSLLGFATFLLAGRLKEKGRKDGLI